MKEEIGARIREVREAKGWTQDDLAREARMSKSFLSEVETGKRNLSTESLLRVATALGASVEYLMTGQRAEGISASEPLQIPPALATVAAKDKMPFEDVVALLRGEQSMLGRRSGRTGRALTEEQWRELHTFYRRFKKEMSK